MGRGVFDLDGSGDDDIFNGLKDTFDSSVTGDLYYAYVDYSGIEALPLTRLGRQQMADTPAIVTFDGLRLATKAMGEAKVEVGAYGGIPVHFYESSPAGDAVLGTYVQARPWTGGRVRADYMYLEDEKTLGEFQNDLLSFELWQAIQQKLFLEAGYSRLENEDRDVRASARWIRRVQRPDAPGALLPAARAPGRAGQRAGPLLQLAAHLLPLPPARAARLPRAWARSPTCSSGSTCGGSRTSRTWASSTATTTAPGPPWPCTTCSRQGSSCR